MLREVVATLGAALLYPFGLARTKRRRPRRAAQRTIVFVHGYMGNRSSFFPMMAYLKAHGIGQFLAFEYKSEHGIEQAAIELKEFLRKRVRGGRIDLVCHSLGGLVARTYLQNLGGARRVDRCITLGTPCNSCRSSLVQTTSSSRESSARQMGIFCTCQNPDTSGCFFRPPCSEL